jgi:hypothetical protein
MDASGRDARGGPVLLRIFWAGFYHTGGAITPIVELFGKAGNALDFRREDMVTSHRSHATTRCSRDCGAADAFH